MSRLPALSSTAVGILLFAGGCSQQYNGAWGGDGPRPRAAREGQHETKLGAPHPLLHDPPVAEARPESADVFASAPHPATWAAPEPAVVDVTHEPAAAPAPRQAPPASRNTTQASPQSIASPLFIAPPAQPAPVAPRPTVQRTTAPAGEPSPAMRPLGLYGQLPGARPGSTSALDSPESIRRVSFAAEGADFDPDIDPTGAWIAYASTQHRPTADLYLKRVGGSTVTQLTNDPGNDVMPAFSPDGKRIAFASDRAGNWDIYLMDAQGGPAVQLTSDATQDLHPSFSPDGRQIVYCSHGTQSGQWELVVVDVENPASKRFIGYGLFPNWSPAEDKIVFQRSRERGTRWFSIWTLELREGEGVRPTEVVASANAAVITPSWSPDGRYLVFCTVLDPAADEQTRPGHADVWVIGADGTGRANLTRSAFTNLQPVWSRDGWIYFVSNRGQGAVENIWSIRGEPALMLARQPAPDAAPTAAAADDLPIYELDPTVLVPID